MTANKLVLEGGKYTLVNDLDNGGKLHVLHQDDGGWRSFSDVGLTTAMYREIERLQGEVETTFEQALAAEVASDTANQHVTAVEVVLESSRAEVERLRKLSMEILRYYELSEKWHLVQLPWGFESELQALAEEVSTYERRINGGDTE